jgi:hypothetical protein
MNADRPIFNFDSKGVRNMAKRMIDQARGIWSFEMKRCRAQRSLAQNAYLWGVVYPHVAAGARDTWGVKDFGINDAHELCRDRYLKRDVVNQSTGEVTGRILLSTGSLDKPEFATYVDNIILFAAEYLRTEIPEADRFRATEKAA